MKVIKHVSCLCLLTQEFWWSSHLNFHVHKGVRSGALHGLGNMRTLSAFEFLASRLPYGSEIDGSLIHLFR